MAYLILAKTEGFGSWFLEIYTNGTSESDYVNQVALDGSGNPYICAELSSAGAGNEDAYIAKLSKSGDITWQRSLGGPDDDYYWSTQVDSTGNVYAVGMVNLGGASVDRNGLVAKYDTNGTLLWQRYIGDDAADPGPFNWQEFRGVGFDSSDNIYAAGFTTNVFSTTGAVEDGYVVKYNSSGTVQWQRAFGTTESDSLYDIAVDDSGNSYVGGHTDVAGVSDFRGLVIKINSSGVIQWQCMLNTGVQGSGSTNVYGLDIDDSGNVYAFTKFGTSVVLLKYNSSGVVQWHKTYSDFKSNNSYGCIAVKGSQVYLVGEDGNDSSRGVILNINTSDGSVAWGTGIKDTGGSQSLKLRGIAVSSESVYMIARWYKTGSEWRMLVGKVPLDGSGTGTFGANLTYSTFTSTDSTSTLPQYAGTASQSTTSYPSGDPSATDSAQSLIVDKSTS